MSATKSRSAGAVFLEIAGVPPKLGPKGEGTVELEYRNYSLMPALAGLQGLDSSNPAVASTKSRPLSVVVPGRSSKLTARQPATGKRTIGMWKAHRKGGAILTSLFLVNNQFGGHLGSVVPEADVEVT